MYCIDIATLDPLLELRSKKNFKMIKDPPAAFTHWAENRAFHAISHEFDFTKSSRKNSGFMIHAENLRFSPCTELISRIHADAFSFSHILAEKRLITQS